MQGTGSARPPSLLGAERCRVRGVTAGAGGGGGLQPRAAPSRQARPPYNPARASRANCQLSSEGPADPRLPPLVPSSSSDPHRAARGAGAAAEQGRVGGGSSGCCAANRSHPAGVPTSRRRSGRGGVRGRPERQQSPQSILLLTGTHGLAGESLQTGGEGTDSGQDKGLCSGLRRSACPRQCVLVLVGSYEPGESSARAPEPCKPSSRSALPSEQQPAWCWLCEGSGAAED